MDVVSLGPLSTASLLWRSARGSWAQTVVCKATFTLLPDESPLAAEPERLNEHDSHWNDDPARSLYAPSDLVPCKPRADVLLVGKAFAPRGEPARSVVARLVVGAVDKSVEVHCDRVWTADGKLQEGPPFSAMPLFYERAGGGPETWNPVGLGAGARPDVHGPVRVPNLQPRGFRLQDRGAPVPPAGFGPVAPHWPERATKLGRHAAWAAQDWRRLPLPDDLDTGWFNAAPSDQQLDTIRDDELIHLEHLHPDHPRLTTTLAGIRPRVYVESGGAQRHVRMECDTLWIDTDRALCTLTWRGVVPLQHHDEAGRILVVAEDRGRPLVRPPEPALPEARMPAPTSAPPSTPPPALVPQPSARPEPPPPGFSLGQAAVLARAAAAAPPPPPPPLPPPVIPAPAAAPEPPPSAPPPPRRGPRIGAWVPPRSAPGSAPDPGAVAPAGSALEASNAAAGVNGRVLVPTPPPTPQPAPSRPATLSPGADALELLWFDPEHVARIRKHPAWKKLIAEAKARSQDEENADAEPREKREKAKERRDVFAVLRSGDPTSAAGLAEEIAAALADCAFTPPLALVDGLLEFPFDEKETLKVTMALVAPFTAGDKRLKEQSDTVSELLKSPWLEKGSAGLESYTARLREAFAQPARALPPRYLEAHTERLLLEQRHYQKRTLLGQVCIRALLTPGGAGGGEPIPTYLPERLAKELPMFQRFRARALVEARLQLDQYEAHPSALRVVALGRVVPTPSRR